MPQIRPWHSKAIFWQFAATHWHSSDIEKRNLQTTSARIFFAQKALDIFAQLVNQELN